MEPRLKRSSATAKMVIYFTMLPAFAPSYVFPRDFSDKGVRNILGGVLSKSYLMLQSYDPVALTLGCKLASFTTELSMGSVDPRLVWVSLGGVGSRFFSFRWVGLG